MRLNLGSVLTGVLMSVAGKLITALGVGFVSYAGLNLLQNKFAGWLQTQMGAIPADALQIFYIAGGGVALLRARAALENLHTGNADQDAGVQIVLRAVESPLRQIVANAGGEPSVVVNKVLEGKGNYGYNAGSGEYGDMIEMGVLDPAKVTRSALQHAASIAGLMLTTDCMIAEIPEEKPAMPDMGGMGGMGGMM